MGLCLTLTVRFFYQWIVDVFAEFFFPLNRFSCCSPTDCVGGELSLRIDYFLQLRLTSVRLFSISLRMAGLLEVVKVFEDLHGIRSNSIYLERYIEYSMIQSNQTSINAFKFTVNNH